MEIRLRLLVALALAGTIGSAAAEPYPAKPIRVVITFPAGGPTDVVVRTIGQRMTADWGQPIVIDNRGGGGGRR